MPAVHTHVEQVRVEWEPWTGTRTAPGPERTRGAPEGEGTGAVPKTEEIEPEGTRAVTDGREHARERAEAGAGREEERAVRVDELVETVYEPLMRRLRADLRLERERRGLPMDSWS
ncbi:hypothetical protein ACIBEJ_24575 [Nonomuraea sp. NPDC050790]|uniref:hypothetical protein n=1 Tax=Nonomuraea sp. NPDC050790 TaxID=3364371 RepID=UPI00379B5597